MPSATLNIVHISRASWLESHFIHVFGYENGDCQPTPNSGLLAQLIGNGQVNGRQIVAERPVHIMMEMWSERSAGATHNEVGVCTRQLRLVPATGVTYQIEVTGWMAECEMTLTRADGALTLEATPTDFSESCSGMLMHAREQARRQKG